MKLKDYCNNLGVKYYKLAQLANIPPKRFYKIINQQCSVKLDEYIAITRELTVPFDFFINDSDVVAPEEQYPDGHEQLRMQEVEE
ncbi:MAG: hypothetical protein IJU58_02295 [Clostridia bacterium]|nr:hypothetical protein [Clostridia bacterium]